MYDTLFCRLYNEFGWNEYPRVFAQQLLEWLALKGIPARRALDLGCGTGVLCKALSDHGMHTLGVDLSEDMVALAREQFPGLAFDAGNMVTYRTKERFDLVTCTGDALNHLFSLDDVAAVFRNVHDALDPGGWFVFDLLNAGEVPDGEPFEAPYGEGGLVRFQTAPEPDGGTRLQIDFYESGALKFSEVIREKVHDVAAVRELLSKAGLEVVQCADSLLPGGDAHGATWFIAAQRPPLT